MADCGKPAQTVDGIVTYLPPRLCLRALGLAGVVGLIALVVTVWKVARCGIALPQRATCAGKPCLPVILFENRCEARM